MRRQMNYAYLEEAYWAGHLDWAFGTGRLGPADRSALAPMLINGLYGAVIDQNTARAKAAHVPGHPALSAALKAAS